MKKQVANNKHANEREKPERAPFESQLPEGWQRFLAHVIEHGFDVGQRVPDDFIRHFPPGAIMRALESEPKLRANILVICAGTRHKIAIKKSAESCGEDLQIALDEDETDAETIVTLFDPDDRVRFLDSQELWRYVTDGDFWQTERKSNPKVHERAAAHIAYIVDRALVDGLIDHREIVEGITTQKITELLPREALHRLIAGALSASHEGHAFSERDLLTLCPPSMLASHVPLAILWERVVAPKIAARHKLVPSAVPRPQPVESEEEAGDLDLDIETAIGISPEDGPPPVPNAVN